MSDSKEIGIVIGGLDGLTKAMESINKRLDKIDDGMKEVISSIKEESTRVTAIDGKLEGEIKTNKERFKNERITKILIAVSSLLAGILISILLK